MKNFTLSLLVIGLMFTQARAHASEQFPETSTCGDSTFSFRKTGHETWPWSIAKPFPWASIQGTWVAMTDTNTLLYFSFRVTRVTEKSKQISVSVYDGNNCEKGVMRGVGVMGSYEKNTLRVNLNNVLVKLALFDTADLKFTENTCSMKALGVTIYDLADDRSDAFSYNKDAYLPSSEMPSKNHNILLKKISTTTTLKCSSNY